MIIMKLKAHVVLACGVTSLLLVFVIAQSASSSKRQVNVPMEKLRHTDHATDQVSHWAPARDKMYETDSVYKNQRRVNNDAPGDDGGLLKRLANTAAEEVSAKHIKLANTISNTVDRNPTHVQQQIESDSYQTTALPHCRIDVPPAFFNKYPSPTTFERHELPESMVQQLVK